MRIVRRWKWIGFANTICSTKAMFYKEVQFATLTNDARIDIPAFVSLSRNTLRFPIIE